MGTSSRTDVSSCRLGCRLTDNSKRPLLWRRPKYGLALEDLDGSGGQGSPSAFGTKSAICFLRCSGAAEANHGGRLVTRSHVEGGIPIPRRAWQLAPFCLEIWPLGPSLSKRRQQ